MNSFRLPWCDCVRSIYVPFLFLFTFKYENFLLEQNKIPSLPLCCLLQIIIARSNKLEFSPHFFFVAELCDEFQFLQITYLHTPQIRKTYVNYFQQPEKCIHLHKFQLYGVKKFRQMEEFFATITSTYVKQCFKVAYILFMRL